MNAQTQITQDLLYHYGLPQLQNLIQANRDLFGIYAATVLRNPNLTAYTAQFLRLFGVIADHREVLDVATLLDSLSRLQIITDPTIVQQGMAGTYNHSTFTVTLSSDADSVLYHELLHFLDHSFLPQNGYSIYDVGGTLVQGESEAGTYLGEGYSMFLVEAGADVMTARYFTGYTVAYDRGVRFYNALEYIYGSDTMSEIFFDREYRFAKLFLDSGYTFAQFEAINRDLIYNTASTPNYKNETLLLDVLIQLYTQNRTTPWQDDPVFVYLLRCNAPSDGYYGSEDSQLQLSEDSLKAYFYRFIRTIPGHYAITSEGFRGSLLLIDGQYLLQFPVDYYHGGTTTAGYLTVAYDFDRETVLSYHFTPKPPQLSLDYFQIPAE